MTALRARRRSALPAGVNLTPLLDAMFNLVFFFLLATTLRTEEVQTQVTLPQSARAPEVAPEIPTVSIDQEGRIFFRGRQVVAEELELELIQLASGGETEIMIRGDQDVGLGRVYEIMDLARRAGLKAVSLQAEAAPNPEEASLAL